MTLEALPLHEIDTAPEWIQNALKANQVYSLTERKIPSIDISRHLISNRHNDTPHGCNSGRHYSTFHEGRHRSRWKGLTSSSKDPGFNSSSRFQKEDLAHAEVLGQVDKKFIACIMNAGNPSTGVDQDSSDDVEGNRNGNRTLVLIDQHAADERIRVERFLEEICSNFLRRCSHSSGQDTDHSLDAVPLDSPVQVTLAKHDASQIACSPDLQRTLHAWGITFDSLNDRLLSSREDFGLDEQARSEHVHLNIRTVPSLLREKLSSREELRELIKGFVAHYQTVGGGLPSTRSLKDPSDSENPWRTALRWCPKELLDLVNSKACRGAIMFNDTLTLAQCEDLVVKLSRTDLPFQCAHGRPSLVPLTCTGRAVQYEGFSRRSNLNESKWSQFMDH